jgi:hypothetical protein
LLEETHTVATLRAIGNYALHFEGNLININDGDAYDSGDDLVKAHPWAFKADEDEEKPRRRNARRESKIEQATAEPGEQRDL